MDAVKVLYGGIIVAVVCGLAAILSIVLGSAAWATTFFLLGILACSVADLWAGKLWKREWKARKDDLPDPLPDLEETFHDD